MLPIRGQVAWKSLEIGIWQIDQKSTEMSRGFHISIKIWSLLLCIWSKVRFPQKRLIFYYDVDFIVKKCSKYKNNDTFNNKTFLESVLKVALFFRFGGVLMLFELSEYLKLCAYEEARDKDQMRWDQVSRGLLGHSYL